MSATQVIFLVTAGVTLGAAVMTVSARKMMHAALWLVLALTGIAVLFVLLQSSFFAVAQVLIYIGAIAILIIFSVMLTRRIVQEQYPSVNRFWWVAILLALMVFIGLAVTLSSWRGLYPDRQAVNEHPEDIAALGLALVDPAGFVIPFEVASLLLLAALVGAIFIAIERKGGRR
jgi:NADH-quinone oxidoreductase subunit J